MFTKDRLIPGKVYLIQTPLSMAVPELKGLLDRVEFMRYVSYRKEEDKKRALISFGLLRLLLSQVTGKAPERINISRICPSCGKPHGKPEVLDEVPVEVNVSHSGKWVLIAMSLHTPVGIDIEKKVPDMVEEEMVKQVLSTQEIKTWDQLPGPEKETAFFRYWTRKEAVLKATGKGLSVPMSDLSVTWEEMTPRLIRWEGHEGKVSQIHCHPVRIDPQYEACLAVVGRCEEIVLADGDPFINAWLKRQDTLIAR